MRGEKAITLLYIPETNKQKEVQKQDPGEELGPEAPPAV